MPQRIRKYIYRTLTQTYDVSDIYSSGNVLASVLESGEGTTSSTNAGQKFTESRTTYHTYEVKANGDTYSFMAVPKVCSDRGIGFKPTQHSESLVYEGGSSPLKTIEIDYEYYVTTGSYGDLKTYKYKDNSTSNYQTDISYTTNPAKHIFGLPTKVQVSSGGKLFRETAATYDSNFADHLTQISQTLNGTDKAVVDIKYDKYGNITQKTLPANYLGQRRFYKYRYEDDFKMYVEEITDNFDYHSFFRNYDSRYGVALETTDINGYTLTKKIDEFGRLTQVLGPKEAAEGKPYTIQMDYFPNTTVSNGQLTRTAYARTKHYDAEHPGDDIQTVTFVDGLGRAIQVKKDAALTNTTTPDQQTDAMIVSGRAKYDAFGRVAAAHYPQTAPLVDWDKFLDSFDAVQPTQTTYDVLDRPLTTTLPDNTVTKMAYSIDGNLLKTEVTDALNNKKASYTNGSGMTEKTVEEGNITTQFAYDPINQAINVTDAAGQQTLSTYDLAGRRTQLIHPDAGKSTYKFDAAGNLLERQTANLETVNKKITYEYDFNRLTKIHYPQHPENDVRYVYGTQNEGNNRRGKVILQEDGTGAQEFSYGITGEMEKVRRTLIAPNNAVETYVTQWKYDSWNRVQEMIYPDEEKITYDYNSGGLLQAIKGYKSYSYNYVNKVGYDKFEQRTYLKYCNGTETKYNYEPLRRRLDVMTVASGTGYLGTTTPRTFMNNKYVYDNVSNVLSVTNSAAGVASKMGGAMKHTYQYDNLYRLTGAAGIYTGADQKTGKYDLAMAYDNLHNIVSKVQNVTQNKVTETAGLSAGYNLTYNYDSTKKHQLKNIAEVEYRDKVTPKPAAPSNKKKDNKYTYDANGNQIYVNTVQEKIDGSQDNKALEKTMLWDEENRLGAISINGYVSSYTYDASGERVSKLSGGGQGIFVNSAFSAGKTATTDFTLYTSPYLVAQSGGRYTKHIYVGSQRIVSKLGDFDSYGADPRRIEKAGDSFNGVKVDYASKVSPR